MEKTILLGTVIKPHGVGGEITIGIERPVSGNLKELKTVFLEIEGKQVPFFVQSLSITGEKTLIIKLEECDKPSDVEKFRKCRVFVPASVIKLPGQPFDTEDLIGFKIVSVKKDISGTVSEVVDNQGNLLLKLAVKGKPDLLIPFHEDLVVSADLKKRIIIMNLPEGLAEINA